MSLAKDHFRQTPHKIYSSQHHLERDKLEHFKAESKDLWHAPLYEEEKSFSGTTKRRNGREVDSGENVKCNKSYLKCKEDRHFGEKVMRSQYPQENVRYDQDEFSPDEYTSPENGYSEPDEGPVKYEERRYCTDHQQQGMRPCEKEVKSEDRYFGIRTHQKINTRPETRTETNIHGCDPRRNRMSIEKARGRILEEEFEATSRRPIQQKGKVLSKTCNDHVTNRLRLGSLDEDCHCCHRCMRYHSEEPRKPCDKPPKSPLSVLMNSKPFRNVHQHKVDRSQDGKFKKEVLVHRNLEYCNHSNQKVLDSYEEMPVVDESVEQRSDATCKASCHTKFSSMSIGHENMAQEKSSDTTATWVYKKMVESELNEDLPYNMYQGRTRKTRSRRTKMNLSRYIKWKKALIHPVVEGSRKKMVGVMILGHSGPEYYSKSTNKKVFLPYRKSRSFPDDPTKSYDMPNNYESHEIFLSASDPGQKPRSELRIPEQGSEIEEKIANFGKSFEKFVTSSDEKFLQPPSKEKTENDSKTKDTEPQKKSNIHQKQVQEGKTDVAKKSQPQIHLMPRELLSARGPKSLRKWEKPRRDVIAYNVEPKTMTECLNERTKQFRLGLINHKDEKLCEVERKFPPNAINEETKEANMSPWSMTRNEAEIEELEKSPNKGGKGDGNDINLRVSVPAMAGSKSGDHEEYQCERQLKKIEVTEKTRNEITGAVMEKLSEEMHRERRKKNSADGVTKEERQTDKSKRTEKKEVGDLQFDSKLKSSSEHRKFLFDIIKNLVKDDCPITEKESENLQRIMSMRYEADMNGVEVSSSEVDSKTSYESFREMNEDVSMGHSNSGKKHQNAERSTGKKEYTRRSCWTTLKPSKKCSDDDHPADESIPDGIVKKFHKLRDEQSDRKAWKKLLSKQKDLKGKKRQFNVEKTKLIREVLTSMATKNEAVHLKQLKKYIQLFIDGVEHKISSSSEVRSRGRIKSKGRDTTSTESSVVRVDAQKLIELVSNPFKRITSDVTIDMARKLTDALIQENSSKSPKNLPSSCKPRKTSDVTEEVSLPSPTTSGSDADDEPINLEGLRKMRNNFLNNIIIEGIRLKELHRFLDKCNRHKP